MKTIYRITDQFSGIQHHYSSLAALCEHKPNGLDATADDIQNARRANIRKGGPGFPITLAGCTIVRVSVWSVSDVRAKPSCWLPYGFSLGYEAQTIANDPRKGATEDVEFEYPDNF